MITLTRRDQVVAYPSLRAAAGVVELGVAAQGEEVESSAGRLPIARPSEQVFAVRATGD